MYGSPAIASSPTPGNGPTEAAQITIAFIDDNSRLRSMNMDVYNDALWLSQFDSSSGGPVPIYGNWWTRNTFYSGVYALASTNAGAVANDFVVLDNRGYVSTANYVFQ